jgi:hypothetical protein
MMSDRHEVRRPYIVSSFFWWMRRPCTFSSFSHNPVPIFTNISKHSASSKTLSLGGGGGAWTWNSDFRCRRDPFQLAVEVDSLAFEPHELQIPCPSGTIIEQSLPRELVFLVLLFLFLDFFFGGSGCDGFGLSDVGLERLFAFIHVVG